MENTLPKKQRKIIQNPVLIITISGFLIRLGLLISMLTVLSDFTEPYFIADDIKYEKLAYTYMQNAGSFIDISFFNKITAGYLQTFWPWIMCITSYIFKSVYASRYINIILSALCIPVLYSLTYRISENKKTAITACSLFAFLPVTVLTSTFPIKDIFITFGVFYVLDVLVTIQKGQRPEISKIIISIILLVCIYFTRGAVSEILLLIFAVFYMQRFKKEKNHVALCITAFLCLIALLLFGNGIFSAFDTKIETYSGYGTTESGALSFRINSITDSYKLPFTYFFATLQPLRTNLFTESTASVWLDILAYANISIYPIAIGNFIYIFKKKKNLFFWLSTIIFYCAVIILSLGIFRHYLFLLPVQIINFALFLEQDRKNNLIITLALSMLMLSGIFLLSMLTI